MLLFTAFMAYLDAAGMDCVHAYSNEVGKIDSVTCQADGATAAEFVRARADGRSFGSVGFNQRDGRPHMRIGVREAPPGHGVIVADVDLGAVVDAIRRAQIGAAGYAYATDANGELIAHTTNPGLVTPMHV